MTDMELIDSMYEEMHTEESQKGLIEVKAEFAELHPNNFMTEVMIKLLDDVYATTKEDWVKMFEIPLIRDFFEVLEKIFISEDDSIDSQLQEFVSDMFERLNTEKDTVEELAE